VAPNRAASSPLPERLQPGPLRLRRLRAPPEAGRGPEGVGQVRCVVAARRRPGDAVQACSCRRAALRQKGCGAHGGEAQRQCVGDAALTRYHRRWKGEGPCQRRHTAHVAVASTTWMQVSTSLYPSSGQALCVVAKQRCAVALHPLHHQHDDTEDHQKPGSKRSGSLLVLKYRRCASTVCAVEGPGNRCTFSLQQSFGAATFWQESAPHSRWDREEGRREPAEAPTSLQRHGRR
jgi:hypothetical protein